MVEFLSQEGEVERARVEQHYVEEMVEGFRGDETTILWFSVLRCVGTYAVKKYWERRSREVHLSDNDNG